MTEVVIGDTSQPPDTHVVTVHCFVALPNEVSDEDEEFPTWEAELFGEIESAIQTLGLGYAHLGVYEGQRWLAPGTLQEDEVQGQEIPGDPVDVSVGMSGKTTRVPGLLLGAGGGLDEPDPAAEQRKAEIGVYNELREAQIAFHRKTAAYVMSMDHYRRIRGILSTEPEDPANPWHPVQGDMLNGYAVMVVEGEDITPHIEMVEKDMRPPYYAGVTSLGVERKDMKEPEFPGVPEAHAPLASDEALEALRRKLSGVADEAPAAESVPERLEDAEAEEEGPADDDFGDWIPGPDEVTREICRREQI